MKFLAVFALAAILGLTAAASISGTEEVREKRALKELAEQIKELLGQYSGKYADFREWLRGHWTANMSKAKDAHDKWVAVAKEVRDHASEMHKETVREAIESLRPHQQELGSLWRDLLAHAKAAISRPDSATEAEEEE